MDPDLLSPGDVQTGPGWWSRGGPEQVRVEGGLEEVRVGAEEVKKRFRGGLEEVQSESE